jgi:hypothetical protein
MLAAFEPALTAPSHRGAELLLAHCRAVGRLDNRLLPASERLELELGPLAGLLISALTRSAQSRRSSSSP